MHRLLLLLSVAFVGCQTAVAAEDYTKAVNAALCTGVFAGAFDDWRASGLPFEETVRSFAQNRDYCSAFARGYFREIATLNSFTLLGRQSLSECTRACTSKVDAVTSNSKDITMRSDLMDCVNANAACRRVKACLADPCF
jgi:hypothetical protein